MSAVKRRWKIGVCACLIGMADGVVRAVFITANEASVENLSLIHI